MVTKKPGRNLPDPALTEDMLCSLALRIHAQRKRSGGRIDRRAVIRGFNEEFKDSGIELTPGVLAGIYLRRGRTKTGAASKQGNQASFVRKYLALHRERTKAQAEAAVEAVPAQAPAPVIHAPPAAAQQEAVPDADQWSGVPRIAPKQFTAAHDGVIALAFAEWAEDRHGFKSPAALAAARINAARTSNSDPIANAYAIQDRIGDIPQVIPFLLAVPAFERKFGAHAPAKAQLVKSVIPPFKDAA